MSEPNLPESWEEELPLTRETFTIQSGDSLSRLFSRAGLNDRALYELMNESPEARALHRIMPGHEVTFEIDADGRLTQLVYDHSRLSSLVFTRADVNFNDYYFILDQVPLYDLRLATYVYSMFLV